MDEEDAVLLNPNNVAFNDKLLKPEQELIKICWLEELLKFKVAPWKSHK
jgi:hypothetical protein